MTIRFASPVIAAPASRAIRSSAASSPSSPSSSGQVASSVVAAQRRVRGAGDPLELVVGEHRVVEDELDGVLGALGEQVALGADPRSRGSSRSTRAPSRSAGW